MYILHIKEQHKDTYTDSINMHRIAQGLTTRRFGWPQEEEECEIHTYKTLLPAPTSFLTPICASPNYIWIQFKIRQTTYSSYNHLMYTIQLVKSSSTYSCDFKNYLQCVSNAFYVITWKTDLLAYSYTYIYLKIDGVLHTRVERLYNIWIREVSRTKKKSNNDSAK